MSEAYKCDRCKAFFEGKPAGDTTVRLREEEGQTKFVRSVCEGCAAVIKDFIEGKGFDANVTTLKCLKNVGVDTECAACVQIAFTGTGANSSEHTCKTHSPGKLMLIDSDIHAEQVIAAFGWEKDLSKNYLESVATSELKRVIEILNVPDETETEHEHQQYKALERLVQTELERRK